MKIEIKDSDIILHGVKCFDLDLTLDCGQAFRWVKEKDGSYSGVVKGVYLNIKKVGDDTFILKDTAKQDFDNIWRNYFDFDKDYVKICNTLKEDQSMCGFVDLQKVGRRQDMGTYYRLNGAIYLQTTELLMSQGDLYGEHSYACVMSQEHSIDIDTALDFQIAETIMEAFS